MICLGTVMMIHDVLLASRELLPACLKDTCRDARVFFPDGVVHWEVSKVSLLIRVASLW